MACSMHRPQHVQTSNVLTLLIVAGLCANLAASTPTLRQNMSSTSSSGIRARQCREGCIEKYATDETFCQRNPECLTCYDECAKPPPPKINKSIRETWSLHTVSMLQQDSLVLVDVAWLPLSQPNQCLVTWEVAGGGLMGNLLTESFNVQLSLWPDTKYRVQVTCKNKLNGVMSRSLPLTIDTAEAITPQDQTVQQHNKQQIAETVLKVTKEPIVTTNLNDIANSIDDEKSVEQDSISNYHTNNKNSNNNNRQPAPISPYDDDESSVETLNQLHTKFIFNWHPSDIHKKPDPDHIVTFAVKSDDMQTSLLIGLLLVTLLILVFTLSWYQHRRTKDAPNDKTALFGKDVHAIIVSVPPPVGADGTKDATTSQTACVADEVCKHSTMCSRNALKV